MLVPTMYDLVVVVVSSGGSLGVVWVERVVAVVISDLTLLAMTVVRVVAKMAGAVLNRRTAAIVSSKLVAVTLYVRFM
jgi:hypothetical protein